MKNVVGSAAVLLAAVALPLPVHAALGDVIDPAEVIARSARNAGAAGLPAVMISRQAGFDRLESVGDDGVRVSQFVAPDGRVFAASWDGPRVPDLKSVMGRYYDTYLKAATLNNGSKHHLSMTVDGVRMTMTVLPRNARGTAVLQETVPAGVDLQSLR